VSERFRAPHPAAIDELTIADAAMLRPAAGAAAPGRPADRNADQ
jgi:hypothetical protein